MNKFHVLTLFPEMIESGCSTSILGRAKEAGHIGVEAVNIRDFTRDKHKKVDDYPYGGGAGMVMQAEPIYLAYQHIEQKMEKKPRVIYVTPQGRCSTRRWLRSLQRKKNLFFCAAIMRAWMNVS